jgi:predicted DNA-binding WGR domain protein
VTFAQKAVAATDRKDPKILDTLAAAYAEVGEFAKAADVQTEAMNRVHDEKEKSGYASRLKLYQSNTPYREP